MLACSIASESYSTSDLGTKDEAGDFEIETDTKTNNQELENRKSVSLCSSTSENGESANNSVVPGKLEVTVLVSDFGPVETIPEYLQGMVFNDGDIG